MTQQAQTDIARTVIALLQRELSQIPKYLDSMAECFDAAGNVNLQQFIGAMAGLPEQLEKMACAAKSYMAVLRDAHMCFIRRLTIRNRLWI